MEIKIPCDVIARFSKIITHMSDPWFNSFRYDDGVLVVSNRMAMVVEYIGGPSGVLHIAADPALIAQCANEAKYDSALHVVYNEVLRYASAKTTMGYTHPANVAISSPAANEMDRWRSLVPTKPVTAANGAMFWNAELICAVGHTSPSGRLAFQTMVDENEPCIIRDVTDDLWFAMFMPGNGIDRPHVAATVPEWMK